jgi:glycosyltransferase involved in cell wall biosynthesis
MTSDQTHSVVERDPIENPDIIIGIPSLNEGDTIANVAEVMSEGVHSVYPDRSANIINVDNASTDDTKEQFLSADTGEHGKKYISTAPGKKGKGRNFYNLFHEVVKTEPDAVAVLDADLTSMETSWAEKMLGKVLEGYDLVTPIYKRHQYDGTITNHVCYPTTYGVNGMNIRQPIGGDFAFSVEAAENWLEQEWDETTFQFGIDIFMSTTTIYGGLDVCSTHLGVKAHAPSGPNLQSMFQEVAGTLYSLLEKNRSYWEDVDTVQEVDTFGSNEGYDAPDLAVDLEEIKNDMTELFNEHRARIQQFLPKDLFDEVAGMVDSGTMDLTAHQWSNVYYSAVSSYVDEPDPSIVKGMLPLYMFRNASFQVQTDGFSHAECEEKIQEQAEVFFENRDLLLEKVRE